MCVEDVTCSTILQPLLPYNESYTNKPDAS